MRRARSTPTSHWSADPTKRTVGTHHADGRDRQLRRSDRQPMRFARARSPPIWRCAIRCWCRRRRSSIEIAAGLAQLAVGQDRRRHRRHRRPAVGFRRRLGGLLAGNSIQVNYTDKRPAPHARSPSCGSTIPAALPLSNSVDARSERQGRRHRFLRRHGVGHQPDQRGARRNPLAVLQPVPATRCASSTTARRTRST